MAEKKTSEWERVKDDFNTITSSCRDNILQNLNIEEKAKLLVDYVHSFSKFIKLINEQEDLKPLDDTIASVVESAKSSLEYFDKFIKSAALEKNTKILEYFINLLNEMMRDIAKSQQKIKGLGEESRTYIAFFNKPKDKTDIIGLANLVYILLIECNEALKNILKPREEETPPEPTAEEKEEEKQLEEGELDYVFYAFYDHTMARGVEQKEPKKGAIDDGRCRKLYQGKSKRGAEFWMPPTDKTGLAVQDFISPRGRFKGTPVEFLGFGVAIPRAVTFWGTKFYKWVYLDFEHLPNEMQVIIRRSAYKIKLIVGREQFERLLALIHVICDQFNDGTEGKLRALQDLLDNRLAKKDIEEIEKFHKGLREIVVGMAHGVEKLGAIRYNPDNFDISINRILQFGALDEYVKKTLEDIKLAIEREKKLKQVFLFDEKNKGIKKEGFEVIKGKCDETFKMLFDSLQLIYEESRRLLNAYDELEREEKRMEEAGTST